MNDQYEYCILTDEKDFIEYEKELYKAFLNNSWVFENYIKINNDRLRPKIPYDQLKIFTIKKDNQIVCAMTVNTDRDNLLFVEKGFKKPENENFYEGINLFYKNSQNFDFFTELTNLFNTQIKPFLLKKNIQYIYSTCNENLVKLYELADWEALNYIIIDEIKKYLIRLTI